MKTTNKRDTIIYWISTSLFAFVMLGSAVPDILSVPMAVQGFKDIGLPAYLLPLVGWAKLAGVIALFIPNVPRLREWAYAGLMIGILGAIYCVAASGQPLPTWAPMFVIPLVGYVSYVYYHKRQRAIDSAGFNVHSASV